MSFYMASGFIEAVTDRAQKVAIHNFADSNISVDFDFDGGEVTVEVGYYYMINSDQFYHKLLDDVSLVEFNDWMQA